MNDPIHIGDFVRDEITRVAKFERWWREQHEVNPEWFPLSMPPGDWDDQMLSFNEDEA